ncbi:MAG TPA: alkaline phosphatase [Phaeodactylibacter sp.]|nr:alkaline phosphatase [Phaeodactylibacter sp.]
MKKALFLLLSTLLLIIACFSSQTTTESDTGLLITNEHTMPKNIILLIGDGMGISQITAAMYSNDNKISFERFPVVGLHKSHASNNLITDSAAGATAFACGVKTYNGAIGVNADTLPVKTILEMAEERGLATGLVATSTIVHATPASFVAHIKQRSLYEDIAADFLKVEVDYLVGGGKKYFDRRENDDRNLVEELQEKGYEVSDYFQSSFEKAPMSKHFNFAYFTADDNPLPVSKGRDYLLPATNAGIRFLKKRSDKGFFMMVEGSQIDWGGHANKSEYIVSELLDFDKVVNAVLDFAKADGETLVIVTADHETGGYAIVKGSRMDSLKTTFSTTYHTADLIPVFAYGPGARAFSGIYENTAIFYKMKNALGW